MLFLLLDAPGQLGIARFLPPLLKFSVATFNSVSGSEFMSQWEVVGSCTSGVEGCFTFVQVGMSWGRWTCIMSSIGSCWVGGEGWGVTGS